MTFNNKGKIAKKIYLTQELYRGPHADRAPDLVILSHKGYDLKGKVHAEGVLGRTKLTGMHTQDDAFLFSNNGAKCTSIFDAKAIILKSL